MNEGTPQTGTSVSPLPPPPATPAQNILAAPALPSMPKVAPPAPWMQQSRPAPAAPMAFAATAPSSTPPPPTNTTPAAATEKQWGPLKPIRTVPKPSDAKVAYVLAQTQQVVLPEVGSKKRWGVILASVAGFLVIGGGTAAFLIFGQEAKNSTINALQVVNTKAANVNTTSVFADSNANTNAVLDTDQDGLSDVEETSRGTDPKKADSDGDGFTDGVEVRGGYNPLGAGKL
ncbi:MAG: hypothetical protein AAB515_03320 [Patescibacteria group bacterium]